MAGLALSVAWLAYPQSPASAAAHDNTVTRQDIVASIRAEPLIVPAAPPRVSTVGDRGGEGFSVLSLPIWAHQTLISPQDGDRCVFAPSCSTYAARALRTRGLAGWPMASDRILRCHGGAHGRYPFEHGHSLDPVPAPGAPPLSRRGGVASLVPGLGQWLAGDRRDALYAFGSVALLVWGATHYVRQDEPAPAAALGSLGAFFYVGSVYGGARAMAERNPR